MDEKLDEGQPNAEGFNKRKRNLLLISSLLIAGNLIGVDYGSIQEFTTFLFRFPLKNPDKIATVIWLFWGYFLIRYVGIQQRFPLKGEVGLTTYFSETGKTEWKKLASPALLAESKNPHFIQKIIPDFLCTSFTVSPTPSDTTNMPWGSEAPIRIEANFKDIMFSLVRIYGRTFWWALFTSEYYLPYIFAVAPVLICISPDR